MEADTASIKRTVADHGDRILKLETVVDRLGDDVKEQTQILREVHDDMVSLRGFAKIGVALLGIIGTVVSIIISLK